MINTLLFPERSSWEGLCCRPLRQKQEIEGQVRLILNDIKNEGDKALARYSALYDGNNDSPMIVTTEEMDNALRMIKPGLKAAIDLAKNNIEIFHKAQLLNEGIIETTPGVSCWRKSVPIESVGLYIPGGKAPLFSTVLMLGIPAVLAGCKNIILCTPPGKDGSINPAILYTAGLLGIRSIFRIGGAQAVAAMAYGTETITRVSKIFGPGNQYVTKAKEIVQSEGIAIDMPAGPSEVLVIADETAIPSFVAADLLSQAEHGPDSQVILLTDNSLLLEKIRSCIYDQNKDLPGIETAKKSLDNSSLILLSTIDDCLTFSNLYAPEHLIIAAAEVMSIAEKVTNAGSVFLGNYSCESAGDYASGTNHTLPTNGYAKSYSGLSMDSFMKKITFQIISPEGLKNIGPAIETMAEAETLSAHKNAVSIRLKTLQDE